MMEQTLRSKETCFRIEYSETPFPGTNDMHFCAFAPVVDVPGYGNSSWEAISRICQYIIEQQDEDGAQDDHADSR
jgi:hypothetical protein